MNKKEKILKYLSGMLTPPQAKAFEEELRNDDELRTIFNETKHRLNLLDSLGDEKPVDELYFTNIVPRAKQKIQNAENKKRERLFAPAVYLALFTILSLLFFSRLFDSSLQTKSDIERAIKYGNLTPAQSEMIDYYLENNLFAFGSLDSTFYDGNAFNVTNLNTPAAIDFYENKILNDNDLFNIIDDNEYNLLLNDLKKLKLF